MLSNSSSSTPLNKLPLELGEELLLQSNVKYREAHPGILYLTNLRLLWARSSAPHQPQTSIRIADIKNQLVSTQSGDHRLKIITDAADEMKKTPGHIFEFVSQTASEDRNAFKEFITRLLPKATSTSTPSSSSSSSSFSSSSITTVEPLSAEELQKRAALLAGNRDLRLLYEQLVKTGIITETEFWASRQEMLENESMKGFNQKTGLSSSLISDVRADTLASTGEMHIVLNPTIIQHIFLEYPAVHRAYLTNVPSKMTEQAFWTRYCESQYVLQTRRNNSNKGPITISQQDELFTECAEDDEREAALPATEKVKGVDPLHCLSSKQHPEEGYYRASDPLNLPQQLDRSLSLIRRLNRHCYIVLDSHTDLLSAATKVLSSPRHNPLRSEAVMPDLKDKETPNYVTLNIPDPRKYFEGQVQSMNLVGRGFGGAVDAEEGRGDPSLNASQIFTFELGKWRDKSEERRKRRSQSMVPSIERAKAGLVLKEVTSAQNTTNNLGGGTGTVEQIQDEKVRQELFGQFVTVNELLKHFWTLFPITPEKHNKLARLEVAIRNRLKDLKRIQHSIKDEQLRSYFSPLREALKKARAKQRSLPPIPSSSSSSYGTSRLPPPKAPVPPSKRQKT
jgi:transcription initiation factor TFIIH subunit 1